MKISELSHIKESNLNELAPYRNNPAVSKFVNTMADDSKLSHQNLDTFLDFLKKEGFSKMGSGSYGAVFTHPTLNYVIKVLKNDPEYIKFVHFCIKHSYESHLPKFRGKPMTIDGSHYMVRMEKLEPLRTKSQKQAVNLISQIISYHIPDEELEEFRQDNFVPYEEGFNLLSDQPDLFPTVREVVKIGRFGNLDLSVNNYMLRGDTIVITDPFASD